jgi:hypothetical protein
MKVDQVNSQFEAHCKQVHPRSLSVQTDAGQTYTLSRMFSEKDCGKLIPTGTNLAPCCLSDNPGSGLVHVLADRFIVRMGEPNVGGKHVRHFAKMIWIWTKLRFT